MHKVYKLRKAGTGPTIQVTLPPIWLESFGLKAGATVIVHIYQDRLEVRPFVNKSGVKNDAD